MGKVLPRAYAPPLLRHRHPAPLGSPFEQRDRPPRITESVPCCNRRRGASAVTRAAADPPLHVPAPRPTDIRVRGVSYRTEDFLYRTPIKFGGVALDRATLLNVDCTVETV